MRVPYFDMAAICVLIVIGIAYFGKRKIPLYTTKIQGILLLTILISCIADVMACELGNHPEHVAHWTIYTVTYVYFISRMMISFVFFQYIYSLTNHNESWQRATLFGVWIAAISSGSVVLFTPMTSWLFYIDAAGKYHRGPAIYILYGGAIACLIFSLINIIKSKEQLRRNERTSLIIFCCMPLVLSAIQMIMPWFLIEGYGLAIAFVLICLEILRPDQLIDNNTQLLNERAFDQELYRLFQSKTEFFLVFVFAQKYEFVEQIVGVTTTRKFIHMIVNEMLTMSHSKKVFYLGRGRTALLYQKCNQAEIVEYSKRRMKRMDEKWKIGELEMRFPVNMCSIQFPGEVNSLDDVYCYAEYLATRESEKSTFFETDEMNIADAKRVRNVELAIDRALRENSFQVYYQPIYNVKEGRITSAEALIRLEDSKMGFISPGEFIPISEKTGQVVAVGRQALEKVCQFISENELEKKGIEYIEVNLSVVECMQAELVLQLNTLMAKYGVKPNQLNLEITESATLGNPQMLSMNMFTLSNEGMRFSLDDYGTGYSNISYMMELPFSIIKIDKSILWSSMKNEKAKVALNSIISMIRKMGMKILVEGVETAEMEQKLMELGCDYLQGYYYSRPLTEEEFSEKCKKLVDK